MSGSSGCPLPTTLCMDNLTIHSLRPELAENHLPSARQVDNYTQTQHQSWKMLTGRCPQLRMAYAWLRRHRPWPSRMRRHFSSHLLANELPYWLRHLHYNPLLLCYPERVPTNSSPAPSLAWWLLTLHHITPPITQKVEILISCNV